MKNFICHFLLFLSFYKTGVEAFTAPLNQLEIDAQIESLLNLMDVPGAALGVIVDGKTVVSKGYGLRNKEKRLPITEKTMFPVGSLSKGVTSFLIGMLVDQNILDWDDLISDRIPYFKLQDPYTTHNITVRDYLTHSSGYPCHEAIWFNQTYSRKEIVRKLRFLDPFYSLREKFFYQNIGYMIVGHAAEVAMEKSYEDLVEQYIFRPLGMNHSTFSIKASHLLGNYALSYNDISEPLPFIDPTTIAPAGGLNSNLEDLLKWTKLLLKDGDGFVEHSTFMEIIKPQVVSDLICNDRYGMQEFVNMESYGLGWILISYRGHFVALHGGNINGFSSCLLFLPNEKIGIVILCNKNLSPFPFILSTILLDKLLDLPTIDWAKKYTELTDFDKEEFVKNQKELNFEKPTNTASSHELEDYLGTYTHPGYGSIELCFIKGKLTAIFNNLYLPLDHWNHNIFEVSQTCLFSFLRGIKFCFSENGYGDIKFLSVPFEPKVEGINFMKKNDPSLTDVAYLSKFIGKYSYLGFTVNIEHNELGLVVKAFGKAPYYLYPEKHNFFKVKDMEDYIVEFLVNSNGEVTAVQIKQPNNTTYTAQKI
jgi:CubicO group peptidase (beta-lactamase class C family)